MQRRVVAAAILSPISDSDGQAVTDAFFCPSSRVPPTMVVFQVLKPFISFYGIIYKLKGRKEFIRRGYCLIK